jgi:hypothetical protein
MAGAVLADPGQRGVRPILWLMPDRPSDAAWPNLGTSPGLCRTCRHAKLNETRRGTVYLRCTRAEWDPALTRYPRLPVTECAGFSESGADPGSQDRTGAPDLG